MDDKLKSVLEFLQKYGIAYPERVLTNHMAKFGISDLGKASEVNLMNLSDSLVFEVLGKSLTRGRLAVADSELLGVLGVNVESAGVPEVIDGVRVLPKDRRQQSFIHFKEISAFILKREMSRYGLKDINLAESGLRLRIMIAFVECHFGSSGKAILEAKLEELGIEDLCLAPAYIKLVLIEFIIQDMLCFYVEPLKARLLRSELVSIVGLEPSVLQASESPDSAEEVKSKKKEFNKVVVVKDLAQKIRLETGDLIHFMTKRKLSLARDKSVSELSRKDKNEMLCEVLSHVLGGMSKHIVSLMVCEDEHVKTKFLLKYLDNYLTHTLSKGASKGIVAMTSEMLALDI